MNASFDAKMDRLAQLNLVFTPGAPVSRRDRFQGRSEQVVEVINAVVRPGMHVVLYGERGVGKTSLANVISEFLTPIWKDLKPNIRVNCNTEDSFKSIWTRVFTELDITVPEDWALGKVSPDVVRRLLQSVDPPHLIIMDEFDRVEDDEALTLMADTIKALSDHEVKTRLVIVGVADSIDGLIGEHESIQRAIKEISLPRMTQDELQGIVDNGLELAGMTIEAEARDRIGRLAEGLPYYVHELALHSAQRAVFDDRTLVRADDVRHAIDQIVKRHSLMRVYETAVRSPRHENLFAQVLTACALAKKDRLGYFTPSAVREPMSRIMGRPYEIANFATHLAAFMTAERGAILKRDGVERKYRYRFRDPLLQPFALLVAVSDGLISGEIVDEILGSAPRFDAGESGIRT